MDRAFFVSIQLLLQVLERRHGSLTDREVSVSSGFRV